MGVRFTARQARERGWEQVTGDTEQDLATAVTRTMDRVSKGLTTDLRSQVTGAGLGTRLANTWRGSRFPQTGKVSIDAAAFVKSNAPDIISAFDEGATIHTVNGGKFLAIPTDNVPRTTGQGRGGSRRMTPEEAEASFHQKLRFAPAGGDRFVAYVVTTKGARTRKAQKLALFVLVPVVKLPKVLGVDAAANKWAGEVQEILGSELAQV